MDAVSRGIALEFAIPESSYIAGLIDERDRALARNRALERSLDGAAALTIQRLSDECEQLTNENDRLRTLIKDAYDVYILHGARLPYVEYLHMIGETRADLEAVIEEYSR